MAACFVRGKTIVAVAVAVFHTRTLVVWAGAARHWAALAGKRVVIADFFVASGYARVVRNPIATPSCNVLTF